MGIWNHGLDALNIGVFSWLTCNDVILTFVRLYPFVTYHTRSMTPDTICSSLSQAAMVEVDAHTAQDVAEW